MLKNSTKIQNKKCVIIGGTFLLIECAKYLISRNWNIESVITNDAEVVNWAGEQGIPIFSNLHFMSEKKIKFNILFSIINFILLPEKIINKFELCINYHDSYLPKSAGVNSTCWAIIEGKKTHGVTWHVLDKGIDTGDILMQQKISIENDDTTVTLNLKCTEKAIDSFKQLVPQLENDTFKRVKQNFNLRTIYSSIQVPENCGILDPEASIDKVSKLFRGLDFGRYPNTLTSRKIFIGTDFYIIEKYILKKADRALAPGCISDIKEDALCIDLADGVLEIKKICNIEGKTFELEKLIKKHHLTIGCELPKAIAPDKHIVLKAKREETNIIKAIANYKSADLFRGAWSETEIDYDDIIGSKAVEFTEKERKLRIAVCFLIYLLKVSNQKWMTVDIIQSPLNVMLKGLFSNNVPIDLSSNDTFEEIYSNLNILLSKGRYYFRDIFYRYNIDFDNTKKICFEFVGDINKKVDICEYYMSCQFGRKSLVLRGIMDSELFAKNKIVESVKNLTEISLKNERIKIFKIDAISDEEKQKILIDWNNTKADYPINKCVHEVFEEQAIKTPEKIGVIFGEQFLTYRLLDQKSTDLAIYLQIQGVKPNAVVGIFMQRSLDMLVGLLGIIKAGGAYVPLDPEYPEERLSYILNDSQANIIITQSQLKEKAYKFKELRQTKKAESDTLVIVMDQQWAVIQENAGMQKKLQRNVKPCDLAYVIYTSGSTGNPKGVMISHQAFMNFLFSMGEKPGLNREDKLLAVTTYCFDIAGLELFLPLIKGAQCYICDAKSIKDAEILKKLIGQINPTIMQATPSTWTMLFHAGWQNKEKVKILCGGEALPESLKNIFMQTSSDAWNLFGPTETTVWSTIEHIEKDQQISIGKPIANTEIYILGKQKQIVPIGVPGELCIAGDGLAKGYFNKPELTAEKFIDHPFKMNRKIYRTGDLARWRNDGKIEYLGRIDFQVKIRGYRIELGEIENQLNNHHKVNESVVIVKEQGDIKQLVVYYVADKNRTAIENDHSEELKSYLKVKLPEYMIPSIFIALDHIPLTPNGKMNRKELMNRKITIKRKDERICPQSTIETDVLEIWQEVLGIDDISTTDGFFEVGGNSVTAVILAERISKTFDIIFPARNIFKYSNIKKIAEHINQICNPALSIETTKQKTNITCEAGKTAVENYEQHGSFPDYYKNSLAIIGISCKFPGARNYREFWNNLKDGKESTRFLSLDELRNAQVAEEIIRDPNFVGMQLSIEGKDLFDPAFFKISHKNAAFMDPQFRLLLLHSWKAIEDAGYVSKKIPEASVFMASSNSYYQVLLKNSKTINKHDEHVAWLLAQQGTIPTMISYELGLRGPSMFVHSNCSSSLTALYSAYQSLQLKDAKYALVGASTLLPSKNIGYVYQKGLNFSSDGHCRAFDALADGMVLGEGVGVILVKRALDAIEDKDHIYALIRGIGINNDGSEKAGYYAPSVTGQSEVIKKVLNSTGIDPESIEYIEAHGTGTKLGDPIEVQALSDVYRKHTSKNKFCAIGSVKSNIGHLDTAAGLAGLIKVVLSLKNKEIPPTINFKIANPEIDFENSPFYVIDNLKPWLKSTSPRRAALSSFGIGGTNSHAILEEFTKVEEVKTNTYELFNDKNDFLIPLSAKNDERIYAYAQKLLTFLIQTLGTNLNLSDISYTLQVGREAMEYRIIFIVKNIDELIDKLKMFTSRKKAIKNFFKGEKNKASESIKFFENDDDAQDLIAKWIEKGKLIKIAQFWARGGQVDWEMLYQKKLPYRISLPTYSFAQEKCSVDGKDYEEIDQSCMVGRQIHPLLQENTSNFYEQRFSSIFTGEEFFLKDHKIKGQKVLPGVVYLEMAHEAIKQAVGVYPKDICIHFENVVWERPITVKEHPVKVQIALFPEDNGQIAYEVFGEPKTNNEKTVVFSQGVAELKKVKEVEYLDIPVLQAKCSQRLLSAAQCYDRFREMGLHYGPGHQGIEQVYVGDDQVLAKLALPSCVKDTQDHFVLHPSMMDAALQGAIILLKGIDSLKPALPFALKQMDIYNNCSASMWVSACYSRGSKLTDRVQNLDIDVCDETGKICVRMKGFASRMQEDEAGSQSSELKSGTLMLSPFFKEKAALKKRSVPEYTQHLVMIEEQGENTRKHLESASKGIRFIFLHQGQKLIEKKFESYAFQAFDMIQRIIKDKIKGICLIQIVVPNSGEQRLLAGLSGLLKTAHLENPKLIGQVIEVDFREDPKDLIEKLEENARCPEDYHVQYRNGKRLVARWREVEIPKENIEIPFKNKGVYLITGGAGGLGNIFSEEIARKAKNVNVIITGRSAITQNNHASFKKLQDVGAVIEYKQADVTQKKDVTDLIQGILEKFGTLNGIIHGAGVIYDNYIIKKTHQEMQSVLAPKVTGLVNLDKATTLLNLDFFVIFSSISGAMGNPGQADYAAANAFMDAYAEHRNTLVTIGKRNGQTLSINWPLWKHGGMRADEETEKMTMQRMGAIPMKTPIGLKIFYQSLYLGNSQVMVLQGDIKKIRETISNQASVQQVMKETIINEYKNTNPAIAQDLLKEKVVTYLKQQLSSTINLSASQIEADAPLEKYGIDSIMVTQMTNNLEKIFGSLSKTLFFEYQNIKELSEYFIENYSEKLGKLLGIEDGVEAFGRESKDFTTVLEPAAMESSIRKRTRFASFGTRSREEKETGELDIAIIGLSGRYPGARNINEFWDNLRDGKDCIAEIPKDRWDHSLYFDEDKNKPGKTYSKWGGFLEGVDQFDPLFFNISPREAEYMDPQERLFLQCVFETLEDAGYTREDLGMHQGVSLKGNVGVYAGMMYEEYQLYGAQETIQGRPMALSGNPSSIANRVSYFFDFHGPSMAVDTMCSSSLTTIHLACQSLKRGGCEIAIAGGVNVSIHPNKYLMLGRGKFVSSKGRCESFGLGGDGYVPGEGVGAVLLKRLSVAEADGDHIYGVIKATAINHGGKTNGYTVPNPNAQSAVIGRAFKEAGINPRTISFLEAHGTGTSLGDPIEIAGLTKAFRQYTKDKQFCAIGSAKSNIGHCESAAGIAGVTKVLLQLKHGKLVPSLHSKTLNPNIDFEETPFVVQQELAEWKRPEIEINGQIRQYPRIAGISSFGAGGSNAHVVIEEYIGKAPRVSPITVTSRNPAIIVLSAKSEDRLKEQAKRLLKMIKAARLSEADLADAAYTLQVGREAMEERLAVIVGSFKELEEKLTGFVEGRDGIEDLFRGQVKRNKETLAVFEADDDLQKAIDAWIAKSKFTKLLDLWVKGLVFDWNKLYGGDKPGRISLPTYPFSKERYWVPKTDTPALAAASSAMFASIHPLLHQNTSDLSEQRFSSIFTGEEFFLIDHMIKGQRVLPGVAYIEMARAAGKLASSKDVVKLENIVWARPIAVNTKIQKVDISLYPEPGYIEYEITTSDRNSKEPIVHSKGRLIIGSNNGHQVEKINISEIKKRCKSNMEVSAYYDMFRQKGINYGKTFQGIQTVQYNGKECLAKIQMPHVVADQSKNFVLHPSMMDAALQSTMGLTLNNLSAAQGVTYLPFALKQVNIYSDLSHSMYAHARFCDGVNSDSSVVSYDIDLVDKHGNGCVSLRGFTVRALLAENQKKLIETGKKETLYAVPKWEKKAIGRPNEGDVPQHATLFIGGYDDEISRYLQNKFSDIPVHILPASKSDKLYTVKSTFQIMFDHIKTILLKKPKEEHHIVIVVPKTKENIVYTHVSGLLKTAALEHSKIKGKIIQIKAIEKEAFLNLIKKELQAETFSDIEVRYSDDATRQVKRLTEILPYGDTNSSVIKPGGVYWIVGGLGGLGKIFTNHFGQTKDVKIVLSGRRALDGTRRVELDQIIKTGINATYIQCDAIEQVEVKKVFEQIKRDFGKLNGIVHCAGIIKDSIILNKSDEEINQVLGPKVSGLLNIDNVTKDEPIDFMIFFSSISGIVGNIGQCDYSAANAFLDNYASYRQQLVLSEKRFGKTLSINWPLWKEGGMQVDESTTKLMIRRTGMMPLATLQGIEAFENLLVESEHPSVLIATGDSGMIKNTFGFTSYISGKRQIPNRKLTSDTTPFLQDQVENAVINICAGVLKVEKEDIDSETDFSEYGVDSIIMMTMLNKLEEKYEVALEPTAIAEFSSIKALAHYLIDEGIAKMAPPSAARTIPRNSTEAQKTPPILFSSLPALRSGKRKRFELEGSTFMRKGKIAIISQACRLPQSSTIEEFWTNLAEGRDLITTVPPDRWDMDKFYSVDLSNPNSTYTRHGGFIKNIGYFDAGYFGLNDDEALGMDPQQRIVLELSKELFDRAGYPKEMLKKSNTSVYIGAKDNCYIRNNYNLITEKGRQHTIVNSISNMIAARVSDFYNLTGTAKTIDTACSSSLVAVHDACESILSGNSDMAIAGGSYLMVDPFAHIGFSKAKVLSDDGISYVFDKRAKGFVMGEGVGLVLLKDYDAALRDNDQILATILGSAVNNDGMTMGVTVPSKDGQKAVIKKAIERSHITPETIGYLEAHGTGTLLGDPIEIKAATEVYEQFTTEKGYCAVGSVKSNLGHTMTAAGITSLIKVVLSLQHQQIPATLHCENPHPRFRFDQSPFYPNTQLKAWDLRGGVRRAAISSFGFGGTNCHVILEEGFQKDQYPYVHRKSLPQAPLKRKWYWLGQEIRKEEKVQKEKNEIYLRLLQKIKSNQIDEQEFERQIAALGRAYK